jgi:hypothetical protein
MHRKKVVGGYSPHLRPISLTHVPAVGQDGHLIAMHFEEPQSAPEELAAAGYSAPSESASAPLPASRTLSSFTDELNRKDGLTFTLDDGDAARTIAAELLEQLADGGTVDVPIRINCAIITGDLDLRHKVFKHGLVITESEFTGNVNLSFATFERGVNLTATRFRRKADFRAARAQKDFHLPLARFDDYACFEDIYVDEVFSAEGAIFGVVDFNRGSFAKSALFCGALTADGQLVPTRFRGNADFSDAVFHGPAFFKGARFYRHAFFDGVRTETVAFFSCDVPDDLRIKHKPHKLTHPNSKPGRRLAPPTRKTGRGRLLCTQFRGKATFIGTRFGSSISFSGAKFKDKADFRRVEVEGTALFDPYSPKGRNIFEPVSFGGEALFWSARIKGAARFESASFVQRADFERVVISGRAYFCRDRHDGRDSPPVSFGGPVNFVDANINGCAEFDGARFEDEVDFERAQIGGCAFFRAVEHKGRVAPVSFGKKASFISMTVKGSVEFNGAQFVAEADFSRSTIEGRMLFNPYVSADGSLVQTVNFGGAAHFRDTYAKTSVQFDGTDFKGDAVFKRLVADGNILFRCAAGVTPVRPTTFHSRAQFESARIRGNAEFDGASFCKTVTFEQAQVGGNLYFRPWMDKTNPARFRGKAIFVGLKVVGDAEFSGARFHSDADFTGLDVGGPAYFDALLHYDDERTGPNGTPHERKIKSVVFGGAVRFTSAHFRSQVDFKKARFRERADFTGVRGESMISFEAAVFRGAAVFREAHFTFMFFDRPHLKEKSLTRRAQLFMARGGMRLSHRLQASPWRVSTRGARFVARLAKTEPEPEPRQFYGSVDLRGCTYERIEVKLRHLMERLVQEPDGTQERADYDRQPFTQIIKALRASGDDRRADFAYLRQRDSERRNTWVRATKDRRAGLWWRAGRNYFNYGVDWFFWHAGNYGVQPERLFYLSLIVIAISAGVFSLKGAVTSRETNVAKLELHPEVRPEGQIMKFTAPPDVEEIPLFPDAFKFSLAEFIPIIDLPSRNRWAPSDKALIGRWFTYDMYASTHRLMGAILVPLLLAAVAAGLYRRVQSNL